KARSTTAARRAGLRDLNLQRWKDAATGTSVPGGHDIYVDDKGNVSAADRIVPETVPANPNPVRNEFFDYYRMPRGFHPRSV
ncbi:alpha/beta hydrolase, partial [Klebsiella pneumoniae]|nr:alpha/beta hydrolase [Klebsiella pneumoniae]